MTDRSIERRQGILDAAVRVFARKGFHTCRVGDIAEEAGVAHGLLYHYFASKDEVLETIFRENWGPVGAAIEVLAESDEPAGEQLRKIAEVMLHGWRRDPDAVRVLVREISRSHVLQERIGEFQRAFDWMGVQRHLKVIGIFARINYRDRKPHYLTDVPRFVRYVRDVAVKYDELALLLKLLDQLGMQ